MDGWKPIETAPKDNCVEFIGSQWDFDENGRATCLREPFISFWSPSLNKFFASPTHWVPMPAAPASPS